MFALCATTHIQVAIGAKDMRIGFDGLWGRSVMCWSAIPPAITFFLRELASEPSKAGVFRSFRVYGFP
jgi:hypothetical protein